MHARACPKMSLLRLSLPRRQPHCDAHTQKHTRATAVLPSSCSYHAGAVDDFRRLVLTPFFATFARERGLKFDAVRAVLLSLSIAGCQWCDASTPCTPAPAASREGCRRNPYACRITPPPPQLAPDPQAAFYSALSGLQGEMLGATLTYLVPANALPIFNVQLNAARTQAAPQNTNADKPAAGRDLGNTRNAVSNYARAGGYAPVPAAKAPVMRSSP